MIPNPATTGINHTRTRYYKTRAGSILAIDRPGIRTRARCVKPELSGDATAELSILFDWMSAFIEIVLSQLILLDCSHD